MTRHDPPPPGTASLPFPPRDSLLRALGRLEREREIRHDPRWELLSEKALSRAEVEGLRRDALEAPRGAALFGAFAPLDEAAQDRIAEKAAAFLEAQRADVLRGQSEPSGARQFPPAGGRSYARRALSAATVLAVAAVALGVCVGLQRPPPAPLAEQGPVVAPAPVTPEYQVEVTGGDIPHAVRGPGSTSAAQRSGQPTILGSGASLAVTLRPARPVDAPVSMVACLARAGVARPWAVLWERSEQGSFHTAGTRETLFPGEPPGDVTLFFAVRRDEPLPTCDELARNGSALRHTFQIL